MNAEELATALLNQAQGRSRFVAAIAGPPAAGKSTLAETLHGILTGRGERVAVLGMDGFHYDNALLDRWGLLGRKGAPETFDFPGFRVALERIREGADHVAVPVFDRSMELARAGAAIITRDTRIVIVEGNYLLLDEAPWDSLDPLFDFSIYLDVPEAVLERRLEERWKLHPNGRDKIDGNDLPNARRVATHRKTADLVIRLPDSTPP